MKNNEQYEFRNTQQPGSVVKSASEEPESECWTHRAAKKFRGKQFEKTNRRHYSDLHGSFTENKPTLQKKIEEERQCYSLI